MTKASETVDINPVTTQEQAQVLSRDEIRSRIFGAKPKSEIIEDFFGTTLELRQPTLQVALENRNTSEQDRVYLMLVDYSFVPGTNDKVFEEEDIDNLRTLPFGAEFQSLIGKVNSLLGIDPAEVAADIQEAKKDA